MKEGEFRDQAGAPALRLIGNVTAAAPVMVRKGSVTRDDLRRDFLKDALQADPVDYLRSAVDMPANEWVPMRYFAAKAGMSPQDLRSFIGNTKGTPGRKELLTQRLGGPDRAYVKAPGLAARLQRQLLDGEDVTPASAAEARTAALAVTGLSRPLGISAAKLRTLLLLCLDLTGDGSTQIGRSEVRKAIARLDELLSSW